MIGNSIPDNNDDREHQGDTQNRDLPPAKVEHTGRQPVSNSPGKNRYDRSTSNRCQQQQDRKQLIRSS